MRSHVYLFFVKLAISNLSKLSFSLFVIVRTKFKSGYRSAKCSMQCYTQWKNLPSTLSQFIVQCNRIPIVWTACAHEPCSLRARTEHFNSFASRSVICRFFRRTHRGASVHGACGRVVCVSVLRNARTLHCMLHLANLYTPKNLKKSIFSRKKFGITKFTRSASFMYFWNYCTIKRYESHTYFRAFMKSTICRLILSIRVGSVISDVLVRSVEATLVTDILQVSSNQSLETRPAPVVRRCSSRMKKPRTAFR